MIRNSFALALLATALSVSALADDPKADDKQPLAAIGIPQNREIQFGGFLALGLELQELRESRRIPVSTFVRMSKEPDTIILDTRSQTAFDEVHIAGAVHLNFSDFTVDKLRKTIPSTQTRVLIYCNNNFVDGTDSPNDQPNSAVPRTNGKHPGTLLGFTDKIPKLALNIPTFINLHGYGYKNVYELADRLRVSDARIDLAGKFLDTNEK